MDTLKAILLADHADAEEALRYLADSSQGAGARVVTLTESWDCWRLCQTAAEHEDACGGRRYWTYREGVQE